jgi:serine/threonine-protein kinase
MDLPPGSSFGPYRIVEALEQGGMAAVYRAYDPALDREVALKVLPATFLYEPTFAERFRQEARVSARLEHPHIVPVHGFGIDQQRPWMAMRLMGGGSLAGWLRGGPLPPRQVGALLRDVAQALDYAHAHGVVHRDVKPANVLLDEARRGYLADFGIARILEGSAVATATGLIQGTPHYMAPEQAVGEKAGPLCDVYSLGVVAYECLTGRVPFKGANSMAVLMQHVQAPVPEPSEEEMPAPLAAVLRRCLAKAPEERWRSAGDFAEALALAAEGLPAGGLVPPPLPRQPGLSPGARVAPAARRGAPPRVGRGRPDAKRRRLIWMAAGAAAGLVAALALVARGPQREPLPAASPRMGAASLAPPVTVIPLTPSPETATLVRGEDPSHTSTRMPAVTPFTEPSTQPWEGRTTTPTPVPTVAATAVATPVPALAVPTLAPTAADVGTDPATATRSAGGKLRVYCQAKLEPVKFRKTDEEDVRDSVRDLEKVILKRGVLELVRSAQGADVVVQVLERGREPAVIGRCRVRVRVLYGTESAVLTGRDSLKGFNTWPGAAEAAAKEVEDWLEKRPAATPGS